MQVWNRAATAEEMTYAYGESRTYDQLGNIASKDGVAYTYGSP